MTGTDFEIIESLSKSRSSAVEENSMEELTVMGKARMIEHTFKNSSNLVSGTYDSVTEELHLSFNNGTRYRYPSVKPEDVGELFNATSPGRTFAAIIRPYYKGTRLVEVK